MIKIAFFVEGQTERIFIERLMDKYFTHPTFNITSFDYIEDIAVRVTVANYDKSKVDYEFLIFNVNNDGRVTSAIFERSEKLLNQENFNHIFGIRDLFPFNRIDEERLKTEFHALFENWEKNDSLTLIIAIMEIEAWFLACFNFFEKINPILTPEYIQYNLSSRIDLKTVDIQSLRHPAVIIDDIYRLVGERYKKRKSDCYAICHRIDILDLCINQEVKNRIPSFNAFINKLDEVTTIL
jgi:hypothetical protein